MIIYLYIKYLFTSTSSKWANIDIHIFYLIKYDVYGIAIALNRLISIIDSCTLKVKHFEEYIPKAFPHAADLILDTEVS